MRHTFKTLLVTATLFAFGSVAQAQQIEDAELQAAKVFRDGNVLVFTIDNTPSNFVSVDVMRSLNRFMDIAAEDEEIGALVITSQGDMFSRGGSEDGSDTLGEMTTSQYAMATFDRIEQFPLPVISAINGYAGQGGLELAMATDIRIASRTASFSQFEVLVGVIPGFGGLQRLPDLVGRSLATDMMLTGRTLSVDEALSAGLVSRISPAETLKDDAMALATELTEILPRTTVASAKDRLFQSRNQTFSDAQRSDQVAFDALAFSPEFPALIRAFEERQQQSPAAD